MKLLKELPPPAPLEYEPFVYEKPERLTYEILENDDGSFEIVGTLVDVLSRNVVISDMHSFAYMQKVLKDRGIFKELRAKGVDFLTDHINEESAPMGGLRAISLRGPSGEAINLYEFKNEF